MQYIYNSIVARPYSRDILVDKYLLSLILFSHTEILCVGERHLEVCEAWNWCKLLLKSTTCLSLLSKTNADKCGFSQLKKGKLHGLIDVGLSVMSIKKKAMCIDLDTEDNIYHLKVILTDLHNSANFSSISNDEHKPPNTSVFCLWFPLTTQRHWEQLQLTAPNLTLLHPGEVGRAVWGVGVKAASPPCVSAERDFHVPPWEAPLPPPCLLLPLTQWLLEKSRGKVFVCCCISWFSQDLVWLYVFLIQLEGYSNQTGIIPPS